MPSLSLVNGGVRNNATGVVTPAKGAAKTVAPVAPVTAVNRPVTTPPSTPVAPGGGSSGTPTSYSRINPSGAEAGARDVLYDTAPFNESKARSEALKNAQGGIDAVGAVYEREVTDARAAGEKDMARANTISAMTGMAGSPDAATREGNSTKKTTTAEQAIQERKALALQNIYKGIDDNVAREKAASISTQRSNAQNVLNEVANKAKESLNAFASHGLSWDSLEQSDPNTLKELVRQTGKDPFELRQIYENSLPPDKKPQTLFEGFKGDNYVMIQRQADGTVKTQTYDKKQLGIPDTFTDPSSITLGDSVYWYDKNAPLGADGKPKLIKLGPTKTTGSGSGGGSEKTPKENPMSFDEWKHTDEAGQAANDELNRRVSATGESASFNDKTYWEYLKTVYDDKLRSHKIENADKAKNYSAATIPSSIKDDILTDINNNKASLQQLYDAYPDVSTSYLSSLHSSLNKKKPADATDSTDTPESNDALVKTLNDMINGGN